MTELLLELVPAWGLPLLFAVTFLSCLAVPVPASLIMLAGGAFVASGDFAGWQVGLASLSGAIFGDQAGYGLGRGFGTPILTRARRKPAADHLIARAETLVTRHGASGVFLSRWLLSPLGPYVNLIGGATRLSWPVFMIWGSLGEAVWVAIYTGLGMAFSDRIVALGQILGNASGALAAGVVTVVLGLSLHRAVRAPQHRG